MCVSQNWPFRKLNTSQVKQFYFFIRILQLVHLLPRPDFIHCSCCWIEARKGSQQMTTDSRNHYYTLYANTLNYLDTFCKLNRTTQHFHLCVPMPFNIYSLYSTKSMNFCLFFFCENKFARDWQRLFRNENK